MLAAGSWGGVDPLLSNIVTGWSTVKLKLNDFPLRHVTTGFISLLKTGPVSTGSWRCEDRPDRCQGTSEPAGSGGSLRPTNHGQTLPPVPQKADRTDRYTRPNWVCPRSVQFWTDFYPLLFKSGVPKPKNWREFGRIHELSEVDLAPTEKFSPNSYGIITKFT